MPGRSASQPPRQPRLRTVRRKLVAGADGLRMAAGARGLTPWLRPSPLPVVEYPKVFVVGCPRSGTTWVADILGRHPRVVTGRESHLYSTLYRTLVEDGRFSVRGWTRLFYGLERGRELGRPVGLHHWVDRPTLVRLGRGVLARGGDDERIARGLVHAVLDSYFVRSGGTADQVLVEKTPLHVLYAEQILATFDDARVVEVVRDGRDVCVSMQMRAPHSTAFPSARRDQIGMWTHCVRRGLALRQNPDLRDRVSVVRYEDLKADPPGRIERLLTEIGLDAPPELVADIAAETDIGHYPSGQGHFRYRGETGAWVDHFSAEDNRLFREMVGDLYEQVGYSY